MIRHWTRHLRTEQRPGARGGGCSARGSINTFGLGDDRAGAGRRADHQVPRRRLDRDPRDGRLLPDHEGASTGTTATSRSSSRSTRTTRCCRPGSTRSCWSASCTSRRCGRWRSPRRRGPTCSRASTSRSTPGPPTGCSPSGTSATSAYRSRSCTRPTASSCARSSEYAQEIRQASPRGVVAVYIPEYVVGRWWEQLLHNQTALRLKGRLLFMPGRHGDLGALPAALVADRRRAGAARATPGSGRATCAAATSATAAPAGKCRGDPAATPAPAARPRGARGASRVGERFTVEVGPVAHGGHCVGARATGRVVFVRHALPGETVEVVRHRGRRRRPVLAGRRRRPCSRPPPDRVAAPCPYAGPDACGGCDFQHVALPGPARRSRPRSCASSSPGSPGSTSPWPSRPCRATTTASAGAPGSGTSRCPTAGSGMRKHRSHEVVPVDECLLEAPSAAGHRVRGRDVLGRRGRLLAGAPRCARPCWSTRCSSFLDPAAGGVGARPVRRGGAVRGLPGRRGRGRRAGGGGRGRPRRRAATRSATSAGASRSRRARSTGCSPRRTTSRSTWSSWTRRARVPSGRSSSRSSTGRPRAVAYVACDPAALARDVAIFAEHGYALRELRAFDLFPMTHHVECVALLEPRRSTASTLSRSR